MVPFKRLPLKSDGTEGHEYHQRNHLLDHFQLNQVERSPVIPETDAIRRYLETILKKSEKPTKQDYAKQRKMLEPAKTVASSSNDHTKRMS